MIHKILKVLDTTTLPKLEKQRITDELLRLFDVSNSLPVDFLQNEMVRAIKELAKQSTAPDKDTPDWLESDIKRGAKWMYTRLTGNDC